MYGLRSLFRPFFDLGACLLKRMEHGLSSNRGFMALAEMEEGRRSRLTLEEVERREWELEQTRRRLLRQQQESQWVQADVVGGSSREVLAFSGVMVMAESEPEPDLSVVPKEQSCQKCQEHAEADSERERELALLRETVRGITERAERNQHRIQELNAALKRVVPGMEPRETRRPRIEKKPVLEVLEVGKRVTLDSKAVMMLA